MVWCSKCKKRNLRGRTFFKLTVSLTKIELKLKTKPMKPIFKYLSICLFALLSFTACQDEAVQETESPDEAIVPNSEVANLMRFTSSNDGGVDDLLDGTDCFSVNLPVTIVVNDITITINTLEDLELIEEIYDEFEDDEDFLEFLFPITIILNDYTEIVIENEEALEAFIDECTDELDETIECVDFVYPISFSLYNADFQLIDTVVIENDQALYEFLESLEDSPNGAVIASLNYPVSLVYADGTIIEVNSNQELEAAINAAEEECDDDDDDEEDCDNEELSMYLQECIWNVVAFNGDDHLIHYDLDFGPQSGTISEDGELITEFVYDISLSDNGIILTIDVIEIDSQIADISGNWLVIECDDDRLKLVREIQDTVVEMVLEQDCEDDEEEECSEEDVSMYLQECFWYSGSNLMNNNDYNGPYYFLPNNVVEIVSPAGNPVPLTGIWDIATTDEGVILVLTLPEPYDPLSQIVWYVVECEEDRIELESGDNHLVFERECEEDYDCPELEANVGDDCEDANGNIGFINENCECEVEDDEYDCPDLEANFGDECENANGAIGFINEDCQCEVEDDNPFDCFGDYALSVCDEDDGLEDGFGAFDLDLIFSNCPNDDVEYTFHETLADAEANVNALISPYINVVNPQTIYSRVSLAANPDVYEIFSHDLIVEDCSPPGCSEQEVVAHLVECFWNVVNYNGSDDLSIFDLDFNIEGTLIIEGDGQTINAMWSSTQTADGTIIEISHVNGANIQAISGSWLVVECGDGVFQFQNNTNNVMILEQNCE